MARMTYPAATLDRQVALTQLNQILVIPPSLYPNPKSDMLLAKHSLKKPA